MKRSILTLFILISFLVTSAQQLALEISGNANFDNSLFSINEAGLDFPSALETQSSIYLSVSENNDFTKKNNPNTKWTITVYKQDTWNDDLELEAKRTGNGTKVGKGGINISGGSNFQLIQNTETSFFEGKGEITNIPVSLKLSGLSVTMGAGSHNSRIIFTVYEGW